MIYYEISRLINFALQKGLLAKEDKIYSTNLLLSLLNLKDFEESEINEELNNPTSILENILDYATDKKIIENTVTKEIYLILKL